MDDGISAANFSANVQGKENGGKQPSKEIITIKVKLGGSVLSQH